MAGVPGDEVLGIGEEVRDDLALVRGREVVELARDDQDRSLGRLLGLGVGGRLIDIGRRRAS